MEPQDVEARVPLDDVRVHVEGVTGNFELLAPPVWKSERRHEARRAHRPCYDGRRHHLARQGLIASHRYAERAGQRRQSQGKEGAHERHGGPDPAPLSHGRQRRREQNDAQQGEAGHD